MNDPLFGEIDAVAKDVAIASRILARHGIVDGFGHCSIRHPSNPDHFLLSRSMAPAMVTADDVMTLDSEGSPAPDDTRKPFLERFIHSACYRARADIGAVVHSHAPTIIPFGLVADVPLRAAYHMGAFIGGGLPLFEIRHCAGDCSDMLIRAPALGAALAITLADAPAVLMRGHGITVVGRDIRQAVFRAIYLDTNARIQAAAMQLGTPAFLTEGEARSAAAVNDGQIDRAWDLWCQDGDI